jgi:hypothetical protein
VVSAESKKNNYKKGKEYFHNTGEGYIIEKYYLRRTVCQTLS